MLSNGVVPSVKAIFDNPATDYGNTISSSGILSHIIPDPVIWASSICRARWMACYWCGGLGENADTEGIIKHFDVYYTVCVLGYMCEVASGFS